MFGDFFSGLISGIGDLFSSGGDAIGDAVGAVADVGGDALDSVGDFYSGLGDVGGSVGSNLWSSLGDLSGDAGDFLGEAGRIGRGVSGVMDPIMRLLQAGQNRQPRLDRGGFGESGPSGGAVPPAFARTFDPQGIRTMGRDLQARGVPPSAVTPDFYRAYLPQEYQNIDSELLMKALQFGRF